MNDRVAVTVLALTVLGGASCAARRGQTLPPPEYEAAQLPPWQPAPAPEAEAQTVPNPGERDRAGDGTRAAPLVDEHTGGVEAVEVQGGTGGSASGGSSALDVVPST